MTHYEHTEQPAPCTMCGRPCTALVDGVRRHIGGFCSLAARTAPAAPQAAGPRPGTRAPLPNSLNGCASMVIERTQALAEKHQGDLDKIKKGAIPLVMDLFDATRAGGRITHDHRPPYPDILHKPTKLAPHQVWLARPKWPNPLQPLPEPARGPVAQLDVPGAYLNAMTTHLPVRAIRHDTSGDYDPRQSGVYLIDPPAWEVPDLPSPLGFREEPGPLWVAGPTLRQFQRAHTRYQLCGPTKILEAWTAPCSEDLLHGLRAVLVHLRSVALTEGNALLGIMVKTMYAKFYATIGESNDNHRMRRPEWSAIIQAQAHANLWERAYKARTHGLQIIHLGGTDELHVVGDWQAVWTNGDELTQMRIKEA